VEALLKDANPYVRARGIWLLSRLGASGLKKVEGLLKDSDPQVRVAAFRALRRDCECRVQPGGAGSVTGNADLVKIATRMAVDSSAAVRREVALAMHGLSWAQSKEVLLAVAGGFDGKDRTYLEALGTGAWKKESELFDALLALQPEGGRNALKWTAAFASIAWRLHPAQSVEGFRARALAKELSDTERKRAVTAVAFSGVPAAAAAMVDIAAGSDKLVKAESVWWLLNRKDSLWKGQGLDVALKSRGIYDPDSVELSEAVVPAAEPAKFAVADVLKLRGDAKRGAEKFNGTCVSCHRLGAAPDHGGIGQLDPQSECGHRERILGGGTPDEGWTDDPRRGVVRWRSHDHPVGRRDHADGAEGEDRRPQGPGAFADAQCRPVGIVRTGRGGHCVLPALALT
jgi:mono/diheme cytochrome c family protein